MKIELDGSAIYFDAAGASVKLPAAELVNLWIEKLQRSAAQPLRAALPAIGAAWQGGTFAGLTLEGNEPLALIVLSGSAETVNWSDAGAWAIAQGGVLPSRIDALVVYQNLRDHFSTDRGYWTSEPGAGHGAYAWFQWFGYGYQYYDRKSSKYRAFAVRRLPL